MSKREKSLNALEGPVTEVAAEFPERHVLVKCPGCRRVIDADKLEANLEVCPRCGRHLRVSGRKRMKMTVDPGTFEEWDADLAATDFLEFPGYPEKLEAAREKSHENDAVVCGRGLIGGRPCAFFFMNADFMMGSMGAVVGEKITRAVRARQRGAHLPVIGFTVSGGARMQEGIISLMQMAKTSGAVRRHSEAGLLYICVLTDPTTGGVTASFAMEGDIILAEPGALVGFAGPRVIEQTIAQAPARRLPALRVPAGARLLWTSSWSARTCAPRSSSFSPCTPAPSRGRAPRTRSARRSRAAAVGRAPSARPSPRAPTTSSSSRARPSAPRPSSSSSAGWTASWSFTATASMPTTPRSWPASAGGAARCSPSLPSSAAAPPRSACAATLAWRTPRVTARPCASCARLRSSAGPWCASWTRRAPTAASAPRSAARARRSPPTSMAMSGLRVPIVSVIVGEGGSGGALGLALADRVLMLGSAAYSVVSPEGCASIIWKDAKRADEAAAALRITAGDLSELGLVDGVVDDLGLTHAEVAHDLMREVEGALSGLRGVSTDELVRERYDKFRKMGEDRICSRS